MYKLFGTNFSMSLLFNNSILLGSPTRYMSAAQGVLVQAFKTNAQRNRFYGEIQVVGEFEKSSLPNGYTPPYTWILAPKGGGLGSNVGIRGTGSVSNGNLAAGKNIEAALSGSGTITDAQLGLIVSMVAALSGTGAVTNAALVGILDMASSLSGSGSFTATVTALGNLVASLAGSAALSPQMNAIAHMAADITSQTELSPENLANAVWNVLTSTLTTEGTTGKMLVDTNVRVDDTEVLLIK